MLVLFNTSTSFIEDPNICVMSKTKDKKVKVLDSSPRYLNDYLAAMSFLCAVC